MGNEITTENLSLDNVDDASIKVLRAFIAVNLQNQADLKKHLSSKLLARRGKISDEENTNPVTLMQQLAHGNNSDEDDKNYDLQNLVDDIKQNRKTDNEYKEIRNFLISENLLDSYKDTADLVGQFKTYYKAQLKQQAKNLLIKNSQLKDLQDKKAASVAKEQKIKQHNKTMHALRGKEDELNSKKMHITTNGNNYASKEQSLKKDIAALLSKIDKFNITSSKLGSQSKAQEEMPIARPIMSASIFAGAKLKNVQPKQKTIEETPTSTPALSPKQMIAKKLEAINLNKSAAPTVDIKETKNAEQIKSEKISKVEKILTEIDLLSQESIPPELREQLNILEQIKVALTAKLVEIENKQAELNNLDVPPAPEQPNVPKVAATNLLASIQNQKPRQRVSDGVKNPQLKTAPEPPSAKHQMARELSIKTEKISLAKDYQHDSQFKSLVDKYLHKTGKTLDACLQDDTNRKDILGIRTKHNEYLEKQEAIARAAAIEKARTEAANKAKIEIAQRDAFLEDSGIQFTPQETSSVIKSYIKDISIYIKETQEKMAMANTVITKINNAIQNKIAKGINPTTPSSSSTKPSVADSLPVKNLFVTSKKAAAVADSSIPKPNNHNIENYSALLGFIAEYAKIIAAYNKEINAKSDSDFNTISDNLTKISKEISDEAKETRKTDSFSAERAKIIVDNAIELVNISSQLEAKYSSMTGKQNTEFSNENITFGMQIVNSFLSIINKTLKTLGLRKDPPHKDITQYEAIIEKLHNFKIDLSVKAQKIKFN